LFSRTFIITVIGVLIIRILLHPIKINMDFSIQFSFYCIALVVYCVFVYIISKIKDQTLNNLYLYICTFAPSIILIKYGLQMMLR
jgi:hypothetical protein